MGKRAWMGVGVLALLAAGAAWRIWANWGLITVNADGVPMGKVLGRISRQAGVRIVSRLPAGRAVTMHVREVSLPRALQVLSDVAGVRWEIAHLTGPDAEAIESALEAFSRGGRVSGWRIFEGPSAPGRTGKENDPRSERLTVPRAGDGYLHSYLASASRLADGQFWAPEDWNPLVSSPPPASRVADVVEALSRDAGGRSAEVFLVSEKVRASGPSQVAGMGSGETRGESSLDSIASHPQAAFARFSEVAAPPGGGLNVAAERGSR